VIVSCGLVASPAEEARVVTRNLLRSRGVPEEDLDNLDALTLAAVAVVASDFEDGWDELQRLEKLRDPLTDHLLVLSSIYGVRIQGRSYLTEVLRCCVVKSQTSPCQVVVVSAPLTSSTRQ